VLCYGATERNGGRREAQRGLDECRRFITTNRRPLVRGLVGLHASFTVSDDTIRDAADLCHELGVPLHVHVAEDAVDVVDARRRGYAGPLERLDALGALAPGSILAHGVHLDAGSVARAASRGCWVVQNPRSNRNNRVGYPRALGGIDRVALGTDGFPADMCDELEALLEIGGAQGEDASRLRRRLTGGRDLAAGLFGVRHAADQPAGEDVTMDIEALRAARDALLGRLVVDGRVVVDQGRLATGAIDQIRAQARREAARLWQRMERL
jgi:cytosine/adenosine deaminase-related metal-dependent hydrolase